MEFQKHFKKHNPLETKVGKFLIPIFQYGSNGNEHAGKREWTKCLSEQGSHPIVECGCLPTACSTCPHRCADGCAGRTYMIKGSAWRGYCLSYQGHLTSLLSLINSKFNYEWVLGAKLKPRGSCSGCRGVLDLGPRSSQLELVSMQGHHFMCHIQTPGSVSPCRGLLFLFVLLFAEVLCDSPLQERYHQPLSLLMLVPCIGQGRHWGVTGGGVRGSYSFLLPAINC